MQEAQPIVRGFVGEDRLNPSGLLLPNVSPDALNVDYAARTIKKRKGYKRLHDVAVKAGGVLVDNSGTDNNCLYFPAPITVLAEGSGGGRTFEFSFQFLEMPTADVHIASQQHTGAAGKGWYFYYDQSRDAFSMFAHMNLAAGHEEVTFDTSLPSGGLSVGTTYNVSLICSVTDQLIHVHVNGSSETQAPGGGAWTAGPDTIPISAPTPLIMGALSTDGVPGNQTCKLVYDEIRAWGDKRTTAEIAQWRGIEVSQPIVDAQNPPDPGDDNFEFLELYWPLNTNFGVTESSATSSSNGARQLLTFYGAGLTIEDGLVPKQGPDGYAFRGDGVTAAGAVAFTSEDTLPASFYSTDRSWTVECWVNLPGEISGDERIISIGAYDQGNGSVMELYVDASKNLYLLHSTATTDNNDTDDTTYNVTPGTAFHVAVVRNGTDILVYIDGALQTTLACADEDGPSSGATNAGILLNARRHSSNGAEEIGPFVIDEVRVWSSPRAASEIADWYQLPFPDTKHDALEAYFRFDAGDFDGNQVGTKNSTTPNMNLPSQSSSPSWSFGLVGQKQFEEQSRVVLAAPLLVPQGEEPTGEAGGASVLIYATPKTKEVLVASRTSYYTVQEGQIRFLKDIKRTIRDGFFDYTLYRGFLIICNGSEENQKYDGAELPSPVTIPTPVPTISATKDGAGSGWNGVAGVYEYTYSFRNSKDGTESLIGPTDTETMSASDDTCELAIAAATVANNDGQVDTTRIYRKDPSSTVFRFLADIDFGTLVYSDDGSSVTANDAVDLLRGHVPESRYCWVHNNSLFFANSSGASSRVYFSEPGTFQYPATNFFDIDRDSGDEVTGGIAAFGGSIIFKERSIHFMTGQGSTTYNANRIVSNIGCVAGQTIEMSPAGVYFLSYDGVYVMGGAQTPAYISHNQQTFFARMDITKKRLACAVYDPVRHQYLVSFDHLDYGRISMVYDEETNSWARWNIGFDFLSISEHTTNNEAEVLGGRNGYLVRLFDGDLDGALIDGDSDKLYYNSSTVTVGATTDIEIDGGQERILDPFPTTEDGLRGVPVMIIQKSDGTIVHRTIIGNTISTLYLDAEIGVSGDISYLVGGIETYWESDWMDMGDPSMVKMFLELQVFMKENADSTFTVKHKTESNETWKEFSLSGDDEFVRTLIQNRGRRFKVRFEHDVPTAEGVATTAGGGEIEGFQAVFSREGFN